jgi:four helix bundle protein
MKEPLIEQKSFEFALSVIRLYKKLQARQEFIVSPQLLRSGTRVGVYVEEASTTQDHQDFVDAMLAASKEARETRYWLRLLQESKLVDVDLIHELAEIDDLICSLTEITR